MQAPMPTPALMTEKIPGRDGGVIPKPSMCQISSSSPRARDLPPLTVYSMLANAERIHEIYMSGQGSVTLLKALVPVCHWHEYFPPSTISQ